MPTKHAKNARVPYKRFQEKIEDLTKEKMKVIEQITDQKCRESALKILEKQIRKTLVRLNGQKKLQLRKYKRKKH